jgi:broad specificity phosphatase PhoE
MVPALSLRLLLIRHAQSQNNAIASQVATKYSGSGKSMQEMRAEFEMLRSFEPGLSETGALQADALAVALKVEFGALQNSSVPVYCSPMVRTILTSQPFVNALGWQGHIKEDLYEVGGSFQKADGVDVAYPGRSGVEYQATYPSFVVSQSLLDLGGNGWYTRPGRETRHEAQERALDITNWLWSKVEEHQSTANAATATDKAVDLCCVLHGDLLGMLLKQLLKINDAAEVKFLHFNTGCTYLDLKISDDGTKTVGLLFQNRVTHLTSNMVTGDEMMRVVA